MIITKEHQEAMIDNYIKRKKNADEVIGYIDGINEMLEYICKNLKQ